MTPLSTEDRTELTEVVRRVLQQHAPLERARAPYDASPDQPVDPLDHPTWRRLADDLGVVALQAPEASGGQGCGLDEVAAVAGELGAVLARTPFVWSSAMVVSALTQLAEAGTGTEHVGEVLQQLAGGRTATTTITHPVATAGFTATSRGAARATLTGAAERVPWAGAVELLVVLAVEDGAPVLVAVESTAEGLICTDRQPFDRTVPIADVTACDAAALVLARGDAGVEAARFAADCGAVVLAAEMLGAATTMLGQAVQYAVDREQFGTAIGAQQAIKHQLADVVVELELARAAVGAAIAQLQPGVDRRRAVATAKALTSDMFLHAADTSLHVHGGMGFTWEQDSHVFLRRARFSSGALGGARHHRDNYLDAVLGVS